MNWTFALLFTLVIASCSPNRKEEVLNTMAIYDSIPEVTILHTDSLLVKKQDGSMLIKNEPYSGYIITRFPTGEMKLKEGYLNGLKEGRSMCYYPSGNIKYNRIYHKGEKTGIHLGWYNTGQKEYEMTFIDGFSEGEHKAWHANGQLYKLQHYKDGREFGSQKVWRPDGKIRANYVIREDGKKYGLMGLKRCAVIDGDDEKVKR